VSVFVNDHVPAYAWRLLRSINLVISQSFGVVIIVVLELRSQQSNNYKAVCILKINS